MEQKNLELKYLTDYLLNAVKEYGIKSVSLEQYEVVCRNIIKFAASSGISEYYDGLQDDYAEHLKLQVEKGSY